MKSYLLTVKITTVSPATVLLSIVKSLLNPVGCLLTVESLEELERN